MPQQPRHPDAHYRLSRFISMLFLLTCLPGVLRGQTDLPRQQLAPQVRKAVAASRVLHEAPRTQQMHLSIGLPLRNQDELEALLPQLSDPASANFHKYLTPEQFAAEYGPTEEDYQAAIQFAQASGLTVTHTHSNRGVLSVSGAAADVERAFGVKLMTYQHPTRGEFYAPDREPTLPAGAKLQDVAGLDNFAPPQPMGLTHGPETPLALQMRTNPLVSGSGPYGYLIGKDFRAAYAPGVTLTGAGMTVGLLEFDGFFAGDETANFAAAGLPAVPTTTVLLDGFNGVPGGDNVEVILDIMMASYMAPGLSKVMVYEGETPNDILNRMATDNLAQQLSSSWGFGGVNATTEQIFKQYIAQGQSFMQASGDSGAYKNGVMTPSDDPNVTVVGGTSVATSGGGGPWLSEGAWSGSGGGISTAYAIPSYQTGVTMTAAKGSTTMRNLPDVALTADIEMYLICDNGYAISVGGTSAAAPLWAGFLALANQQAAANAKPRVGFLNPLVYAIGESGNYALDFHDITTGNTGYAAVTGYDLATGWGSPMGQHLIYDLTGTAAAPGFNVALPVATLGIRQPATGATTGGATSLTVTPVSGFTGTVGLAVTGLPAGVTAVFSPASTVLSSTAAASSTLTFTVGTTAVAGTYPLTITGLSGKVSNTATLTFSVLAPSFTLTPSSAVVTVVRPGSSTTTIAVGAVNGFSGSVALTTGTLPTGVTAAFSAATATASSIMTITAGSTAVNGTYTLMVNGVSGTLKSSTTVAVTVGTPSFALTPSSAALTLNRPSSGTSTIAIGAVNGFTGSVALTVGTLPAGITATLSGANTVASNVLTLTAGSTALAGVYPITINGVSGSLTASTTVTVTVVLPKFTLTPSTTAITISRPNSESSIIAIGATGGFTGTVALTASNLPAGLTAAFSTSSATAGIVFTATASSAAAAGVYPIAINGVSGSLIASTVVTVTVVIPTFTLTPSAAAVTISRPGTATSTIAVGEVNGFTGSVQMTIGTLPAGVTAAWGAGSANLLTITASSTAATGLFPVTVTGTSGTLKVTTTVSVTVLAPSFTLAFTPASLAVPRGGSSAGSVTIGAVNGFSSTVTFAATGLPTGVTALFGTAAKGVVIVNFLAPPTAVAGSYAVTIAGVSGTLTASAHLTLVVVAPSTATNFVNLAPNYNTLALAMDGVAFTGAGIDGAANGTSEAYSANLTGVQQTIGGTAFYFGPAGVLDAVSGQTVVLPAGQFASLKLLATAVNGGQMTQTFKVTYTDGTSTSVVQSLSDWFSPASYTGETKALTMAHRDTGTGLLDNRNFNLYEYSITLNSAKTVANVTFPNNSNVVVLAASLAGQVTSSTTK